MVTMKLITILSVIMYIIYKKIKERYTYWERRGVKGIKPYWLVGNVLPMLRKKKTLQSVMKKTYNMYPNEKAIGIYIGTIPTLILKDLSLIKNVLVKDYTSFADRGLKLTDENIFNSVFFEKGDYWKVYRQKFTPLFTTEKMKNLMPELSEYTDQFLCYIENLPPGPKELRELDRKLSVRVTLSSSFGLKEDSFHKEFDLKNIGDLLKFPARLSIAAILYGLNPKLISAFGLNVVPENFIDMLIDKSIAAEKENPRQDKNAFDYMVKLKDEGVVKMHKNDEISELQIDDSVVAGHAAVFMAAGLEVYSNSSFLLFELAKNQNIQERCYKEIEQVMEKYNGDLTFEALNELQYVNMAFDESLRMYPNGGSLFRVATKDYYFEDIDLVIQKGMPLLIPVQAIHYDPKNFPDPEIFDPERFSPENKKTINECSYLPFGEGPRKCIGLRLIRFQSILLLAKFLHRFKVTPCEKTVPKPRMKPLVLSLYAEDGLWVNITNRKQS